MKRDFFIFELREDSYAWELAYIFDDYQSIVWHMVYDGIGECDITAPLTDRNALYIRPGSIIANSNPAMLAVDPIGSAGWAQAEFMEACIITNVTIDYDAMTITASGESLETLLDWRVIPQYGQVSGTASIQSTVKPWLDAMEDDLQRRFQLRTSALDDSTAATVSDYAYSWKTIWEAAHEMALIASESLEAANPQNGQAFMIRVMGRDVSGSFQIEIGGFWSVDRTVFWPDSTGALPVTIRDDVDEISGLSIEAGIAGTANAAYVAGEGEGAERVGTWYIAPEAKTGGDRRETFVDARDLKREDYGSDDAYLAALRNRGREKISQEADSLQFTISETMSYTYRRAFDIRDVVNVAVTSLGMRYAMRVAGCVENFDQTGYSATFEFGQPLETFAEKINKKLR